MTPTGHGDDTATVLAGRVRSGQLTAAEAVQNALNRLEERGDLGMVTALLPERALRSAAAIDAAVSAGRDPGPLAGVPFGVKDLFDLQGVVTLAGSIILANQPPATRDAAAVRALEQAGAVCVATLRMDEFAYGFTTQNSHYGSARNPHDPAHIAGGSSGGSAAAVASGALPLTLGTDTNGSIRVPAALCGIFSWKPTYGTVSRAGTVPFVDSLDCVGVMSRSVADLHATLDLLTGADTDDPACRGHLQPAAMDPVRVGALGGWFAEGGDPAALSAVEAAGAALDGAACVVELPLAGAARAAAMLVTASEGAAAHLGHLRSRGRDFDPMTRERFLAGALLPAAAYGAAQRLRTAWCRQVALALRDVDVLLAPAVPFPAPRLDEGSVVVGGRVVQAAPNLGMWTQPISFAGLPVVTVPVLRPEGLPLGVQVVARPWEDRTALAVAAALEAAGFESTAVTTAAREVGSLPRTRPEEV